MGVGHPWSPMLDQKNYRFLDRTPCSKFLVLGKKKRLNYPNGPPLHNFHHDAVRSKCILQLHQRSLNRVRWIDGVRYLWKRPVVKKWHPKKIICLPQYYSTDKRVPLDDILNRKIDIKVEDLHKNKESSAAAAIFCEVLRLKSQINDVRGSWG